MKKFSYRAIKANGSKIEEQYEANFDMEYHSTILKTEELDNLDIKTTHTRCNSCENHCLLTINKFSNGKKYISVNRCEKGAGIVSENQNLPNLVKYKYDRIFIYTVSKESLFRRKNILWTVKNLPIFFFRM